MGGGEGTSPSKVSLFTNRDDIDFGNAEDMKPAQELELAEDLDAKVWYPLK